MKIKVKTIDSQVHSIDIDNEAQLKQLNLMLQERLNIRPSMQRIIFQGKVLRDENKKLTEFGIVEDMTLHLIERNPELAAADNLSSYSGGDSGGPHPNQSNSNNRNRSSNDEPQPATASQQGGNRRTASSFGLVSISLEGNPSDFSGALMSSLMGIQPSFVSSLDSARNAGRSGSSSRPSRVAAGNSTNLTSNLASSRSSQSEATSDYTVAGNVREIHEFIEWIRNFLRLPGSISSHRYLDGRLGEMERLGYLIEEATNVQERVGERLRQLGEMLRGTILNETERRSIVDESVKVRKLLKRIVQLLYRLTNLIELGSDGTRLASLISRRATRNNLSTTSNNNTSLDNGRSNSNSNYVTNGLASVISEQPSRRNIFPFIRSLSTNDGGGNEGGRRSEPSSSSMVRRETPSANGQEGQSEDSTSSAITSLASVFGSFLDLAYADPNSRSLLVYPTLLSHHDQSSSLTGEGGIGQQESDINGISSTGLLVFLERIGRTLSIQDLINILIGDPRPLANTLPVWRSLECLLMDRETPSLDDFQSVASRLFANYPFRYSGANASLVITELRNSLSGVFAMFLRRLHFYLSTPSVVTRAARQGRNDIDPVRFSRDLQMIFRDSFQDVVGAIRQVCISPNESFVCSELEAWRSFLIPLMEGPFSSIIVNHIVLAIFHCATSENGSTFEESAPNSGTRGMASVVSSFANSLRNILGSWGRSGSDDNNVAAAAASSRSENSGRSRGNGPASRTRSRSDHSDLDHSSSPNSNAIRRNSKRAKTTSSTTNATNRTGGATLSSNSVAAAATTTTAATASSSSNSRRRINNLGSRSQNVNDSSSSQQPQHHEAIIGVQVLTPMISDTDTTGGSPMDSIDIASIARDITDSIQIALQRQIQNNQMNLDDDDDEEEEGNDDNHDLD